VLAAEEELRHLLAPAPEDPSAPDWLLGAPPLVGPARYCSPRHRHALQTLVLFF